MSETTDEEMQQMTNDILATENGLYQIELSRLRDENEMLREVLQHTAIWYNQYMTDKDNEKINTVLKEKP